MIENPVFALHEEKCYGLTVKSFYSYGAISTSLSSPMEIALSLPVTWNPAGICIVAGFALIGGVYYFIEQGREKAAVEKLVASGKEDSVACCCDPSKPIPAHVQHWRNHFVMCPNRKTAHDKARHHPGANEEPELHAHNTVDRFPHFHPKRDGKKIPGIHYQFPK